MTDRHEKVKQLIRDNPNVSLAKLYNQAKDKGIGIRKQTFYEYGRVIRAKSGQPTKPKPKPVQKKPIKIAMPKQKGQYGIARIDNKTDGRTYWIKYNNRGHFNKQFDIVKRKYKADLIISTELKNYKSFIDSEFADKISDWLGVSV